MTSAERVKVEEVLVLRVADGDDPESESAVAAGLFEATGATVIVLRGDATLESLDEDAMRDAGWVRADTRAKEGLDAGPLAR